MAAAGDLWNSVTAMIRPASSSNGAADRGASSVPLAGGRSSTAVSPYGSKDGCGVGIVLGEDARGSYFVLDLIPVRTARERK